MKIPQRQLLSHGTILQGECRIDGIRDCGGFGAVYHATDLQTNELIAIKENHQHRTFVRFEREAKLLMQLSHPNLPKVGKAVTNLGAVGKQQQICLARYLVFYGRIVLGSSGA